MKNVNVFVLLWSLCKLIYYSLILSSHPFAPVFSYTRIPHHQGNKLLIQYSGIGLCPSAFANLEESGTGIRHEIGLAALGTAINDSAAPTYINLIFALSLMGDMPTNKARTSDNAQKQSASNAVPIFYYYCFVLCSLSNNSSSS